MYKFLQDKITEVACYPVNSPRDCKLLSEDILKSTGRAISETTLRRFFGILKNDSNFSIYNLDTIAIYVGYKDYKSYAEGLPESSMVDRPTSSNILRELEQVTKFTLGSISRKSLTRFKNTIPRESIHQMLDAFLESDRMVMPLIAPGGYGKSIALAHWILAKKGEKVQSVHPLFCTASFYIQLMQARSAQTGLLSFDLTDPGNLFRIFEGDKSLYKSPLLLVVDGIDELEGDLGKILELASGLSDLAVQYQKGGMLKIVISVREVTWNKYVKHEFEGQKPGWLLAFPGYSLESGSNNVPELSSSEVRKILSMENEGDLGNIVYDCIHWEMRQLIRVPLNLHFFRSMIQSLPGITDLSSDRLLHEYLNNLIFKSRFSDEKTDLVWELVRSSMNSGQPVRKNDIRRKYPIHLKREANYYIAYNELVSDSILLEEKSENKFGLFSTYIRFSHFNILYYLTALYLTNINERVYHELLKGIVDSDQSMEWRSNVLAYAIQIAYRMEELDALKKLCELDEEVLSTLPVRQAVGDAFRRKNGIRDALVRKYAAHPVGQVQFFEKFVDTNYLFNNFSFRIREYLKHKDSLEARLFGHGILFLADFIGMNHNGCDEQIGIIETHEPDKEVYPWPIGRKVGNTLLYSLIVQEDSMDNPVSFIDEYTKIAYMYPGYLERGAIEYEMMILLALSLAGKFDLVLHVGENFQRNYNFSESAQSELSWRQQYQNDFARCYIEFARFKLFGNPESSIIEGWEDLLNTHMSVFDDFQNLIMLQYFLFDYYFQSGQEQKASHYFYAALEISRFAEYNFYETFLLKKGAGFDPSASLKADEKIRLSGFNPSAYCFTEGI